MCCGGCKLLHCRLGSGTPDKCLECHSAWAHPDSDALAHPAGASLVCLGPLQQPDTTFLMRQSRWLARKDGSCSAVCLGKSAAWAAPDATPVCAVSLAGHLCCRLQPSKHSLHTLAVYKQSIVIAKCNKVLPSCTVQSPWLKQPLPSSKHICASKCPHP